MDINQHVSNEMTNKGDSSMKKMKHLLKNQKGLTLVELLAVIVIIAIVSAIAVPAIGGIIENSRYNAVKADGINVLNASKMYFIDNPEGSKVTIKELKDKKYLESLGKMKEEEATFVTKDTPNKLTTSAITYSGSQTVTFTNATLDMINNDKQKGSETGNKTIPGTPATTPTTP